MTGSRAARLSGMLAALLGALAQAAPPPDGIPVSVAEPLPEPLSLEYALSLAASDGLRGHPELLSADAQRQAARAARLRAESALGLELNLQAEARYVDPSSLAPDSGHDDSRLGLVLNKPLYDFGRTRAGVAAAEADISGSELAYLEARRQRRLEVMKRYFDVLLADLAFAVENEAMAIVYIRQDRARDRNELGQLSDIEVLEEESAYQAVRARRYAAEAEQRHSRARLAEGLDRPGQLPSTLAGVELPAQARPLPDYAALERAALANSPALQALAARQEAARQRVEAARAGGGPVLSGNMEATEYAREFGSRDHWRAGLLLDVPLYRGGRVQAEVAAAQADWQQARADYAAGRSELRQALLAAWQQLEVQRARRDEARTQLAYRELYLDRSRALYEMEVKTDLGDAMVRFSEARLQHARAEYQLALAWATLAALSGDASLDPFPESLPAPAEEPSL